MKAKKQTAKQSKEYFEKENYYDNNSLNLQSFQHNSKAEPKSHQHDYVGNKDEIIISSKNVHRKELNSRIREKNIEIKGK